MLYRPCGEIWSPCSSKLRKLLRTVAAIEVDGALCNLPSISTTTATSAGFEGLDPVLVKGPSVSVSNLSIGMAATMAECRWLSSIAALIEK